MRFWSESMWEMDRDQKIGPGRIMARLVSKCWGLSVRAPPRSVLRHNQFQFASTWQRAVNNGGLVANMQPVMDHNHTVMTVCNKVTLPRIIFCFSRWISSFQGEYRDSLSWCSPPEKWVLFLWLEEGAAAMNPLTVIRWETTASVQRTKEIKDIVRNILSRWRLSWHF